MELEIADLNPGSVESTGLTPDNIGALASAMERYLRKFVSCPMHKAQKPHFVLHLKGLMSNLERKSFQPIALQLGETRDIRIKHHFLKSSPWDHVLMMDICQRSASLALSGDYGMITVDGCDFPKKGNESAGVSRQRCGPLGKRDSCQASVMIGYVSMKGYCLVDRQLYLTEKWLEGGYAGGREDCEIPGDVKYLTKAEIAAMLLNRMHDGGEFNARWVGASGDFCLDAGFVDSIQDSCSYFIDVRPGEGFFEEKPRKPASESGGRGLIPNGKAATETPSEAS
jgi:SRSO17 transposase